MADEQEQQAVAREGRPELDPEEAQVYAEALRALNRAGVPYAVGGAWALHSYTGLRRSTKDLDLFLRAEDLRSAMDALAEVGFEANVEYPHWLAKAHRAPYFVDLIFANNNSRLRVDQVWLDHGQPVEVAGVPCRVISAEELIASKAYIGVRHRFDGADVAHVIRGVQGKLDWQRILSRLGDDAQLLLWHLIFFDFVYPGHAEYLPRELMVRLFEQASSRWSTPDDPKRFRGTVLDQFSFVVDVEDWGYEDPLIIQPLVDEEGNVMGR